MAQPTDRVEALPRPRKRRFVLRDLWRAALWGLGAAIALTVAGYASVSETGQDRIAMAAAYAREMVHPTGRKAPRPMDAEDGRKLAEAVRLIADDRDRLQARLAALEGNLGDLTGSVARVEKSIAERPAATEPEKPAPATEDVTSSIATPSADAPPPLPSARPDFGIDLGSANTLDGLRNIWNAVRQRYAGPMEGLRPIVHLRERPRPAPVEFRLVAGPLPNAAAAARLCATLVAAGALCQPAVFDGQRLAVR